jgi:glutaredoxin
MSPHRITLYAAPGCPMCDAVRTFFRGRGAEFADVDVTVDEAGARELLRLTGSALVPTIVVGDDVQVGWDESRVAEMLDDPLPEGVDEVTRIVERAERILQEEVMAGGIPGAEDDGEEE